MRGPLDLGVASYFMLFGQVCAAQYHEKSAGSRGCVLLAHLARILDESTPPLPPHVHRVVLVLQLYSVRGHKGTANALR